MDSMVLGIGIVLIVFIVYAAIRTRQNKRIFPCLD